AGRANYKFNPRMVPSRLATASMLKNYDVCILVNCAVQTKAGVDALGSGFVEALKPFVNEGHGLLIFSGPNVQPDAYNRILNKKLGLMPTPIKAAVKTPEKAKPFLVDRRSFRHGPPGYWIFKDDPKFFKTFDEVEVRQHLVIDEAGARAQHTQQKQD